MRRFLPVILVCILGLAVTGAGCAAVVGADAGMIAGKEIEKNKVENKEKDKKDRE